MGRYGESAILVEWEEATADLRRWLTGLSRGWRSDHPPEVRAVQVAERSLVILLADDATPADPLPADVVAWLSGWVGDGRVAAPRHLEIAVVYDGPDLVTVAHATGLEPTEVVALHAGAAYQVGWLGFLPGFAYLEGLPARLRLPRRSPPRPRVAGGAVAIAEGLSAVYPFPSPGGWHWIGRTAEQWQPLGDAMEPIWQPGDTVRFVAVDGR